MKKYILGLLVILLLTACTTNSTRNNWAYEEYERMIEPTSTGNENYRDYEATIPEEPQDSDMDGWNNNFDLCPDEAALEVGVNHASGPWRGPAVLNGPGAYFILVHSEVADQIKQAIAFAD